MEGKRFRRIQNGQIYNVIGRDETPGQQPRWIVWNDQTGQQEHVDDHQLKRQLGWELVGTSDQKGTPSHDAPPSLIKKTDTA